MNTRREFLALAATAAIVKSAAGRTMVPGSAPQAASGSAQGRGPLDEASALVTGKPKPLRSEEIKGFLSKEQLAIHHSAHYGGAVKSLTQIETELQSADLKLANANWSAVRELKREQVHALNSVLLHELYFGGFTTAPQPPSAAVDGRMKQRFGSIEKWIEDLKAAALAARGWAVLALQPTNGKLYNVVTDVHDVGPMVLGIPLVVIDCYEHAFYVDYKNKKGDYVAAFPPWIDWAEIERRFDVIGR